VYAIPAAYRVARSLDIFSRTFCFSRDTLDYFHGSPQRVEKGVFAPSSKLGLRTKNVRKSEVTISIPINLILAITLYLPVWHSHCTKASFTVLV